MRRAKGVIDVDISEFGQLLGEFRVVLLFFGVIANVLEQDDIAGLEGVNF